MNSQTERTEFVKAAVPLLDRIGADILIVVEGAGLTNGLVVDQVDDVVDLATADLEPAPNFGDLAGSPYIRALGKAGGRVVILLDSDRLLHTRGMRGEADL